MRLKRILQVKWMVLAAAVLLTTGMNVAQGQEVRASLGGRVTDSQGAAIPNAKVAVISDDTNVEQHTTTNGSGVWVVKFLLPGHYHFTATSDGFKTTERKGITLQTADDKTVDVQLEIGATSQSIDVVGEVPLIDTTMATSGTVINSQEMAELPSISRVPTLMAILSPGVVQQDQNNNPIHGWSYNGASQIEVNGGRYSVIYANFYMIDGFPNVKSGGNIAFIPSQDLIGEFRVQLSAYDASIGRQAGGTFNMTSKSGTKDYHGTLYEFNQNYFLNAKQFQLNLTNAVNPPIHLNQWGFTFGGPVWIPKLYNGKKKTFFFMHYEGLRNLNPQGGLLTLPTQAERNGDFSQSYTTQVVAGQRTPLSYTIFDPASVDSSGNRTPFPNAVIPANRQNQISQNILKYVSLPNQPSDGTSTDSGDYVSPAERQDKMAVFSARGDQQWSDTHRSFIVVRWDTNHETQGNNFGTPASGTDQVRTPKQVGVDHIWTAGANKVLDLRFVVNRYEELTQDEGTGFDPTKLGFSPSVAGQFRYPEFPQIGGIIGSGNYIGTGTNTYNMNTYYTWSGSLTHVHGNHTFRYGAEYWALQIANSNYGGQPQIDFSNVDWTNKNNLVTGVTAQGNIMSQFMLGLPTGGSTTFNSAEMWSQRFAALHFQDDWRPTSRLTLNFGLRWDYERPFVERYNIMTSSYDPTAVNPVSASAQAAYASMAAANATNTGVQQLLNYVPVKAFQVLGVQKFAGVNGQSRQATQTDYREVQPRFGFAYRLGPNTVLRGGVGRFVMATQETGGQNGFSISTALNASNDNYITPAATLSNPYPNGLTQPTGSSLGALTNLGNGVNFVDQNPNRPYAWQYSLTLQHQFKSWLFEAGYSHNKTEDIWVSQNQNLPSVATWQALNTVQFDATGKPQATLWYNTQVPNPFKGLAGVSSAASISKNSTVAISQLVRPITILGDTSESDMPLGKNQYDALLMKVEHRLGKGLTLIDAFTWSKLMEDMTFMGPQNLNHLEHRLGSEDRPFHLSVAAVWNLPVGRDKALGGSMPKILDWIAGGWEMSGQYTLQSGIPVMFNANTTNGNFFFSGKDFSTPRDQRTFAQWFDISQFAAFPNQNQSISNYPAWTGVQSLPGASYVPLPSDNIKNGVYQDFASWIRTIPTDWRDVRTSRVNEMNLGIFKNFRPKERIHAQFRFETYNTLNHARFAAPDSNPADAAFGQVSKNQQNSARTIQMALKMNF
jgi:hypothetical protein